jgi:hypothetical protein
MGTIMRARHIVFPVLTITALIAEVAILYFATEQVGGRAHFSPDTLQMRGQMERRCCWSGFTYHRPKLVEFLIAEGYWSPREAPDPRWIEMFHWNTRWRGGTSRLQKELNWREDAWIDWTEKNKEFAKTLWPRVLDALRSPTDEGQQDAIVMLMHAQFSADAVDFEERMVAEKR